MSKEEIKALVAAKIAGQGSAIDAASVLPTILNAIVDVIPELAPIAAAVEGLQEDMKYYIASQYFDSFIPSEYSNGVEITEDIAKKICAGSIFYVDDEGLAGKPPLYKVLPPFNAHAERGALPMATFVYGLMEDPSTIADGGIVVYVYYVHNTGKYYIKCYDNR